MAESTYFVAAHASQCGTFLRPTSSGGRWFDPAVPTSDDRLTRPEPR